VDCFWVICAYVHIVLCKYDEYFSSNIGLSVLVSDSFWKFMTNETLFRFF